MATVGLVLRRRGLGRLSNLDPKPEVIRYQRERTGELIHIDVKKLGKIAGVGHRITGDRHSQKRGTGWEFLHVCVDDAARLAYTERTYAMRPGCTLNNHHRPHSALAGKPPISQLNPGQRP